MKNIRKIVSSLGTINEISLYFNETETEKAKKLLDSLEKYLYEIDDKWSVFKENSEVSLINKNAGIKEICVSSDTFEIKKLAKEYGKM